MISNITIDVVMDYILVVLTEDPKEYILENPDMSLMLDMIRDGKHIMNTYEAISSGRYIGAARINTSRGSITEMNIMSVMFRQLGYKVKYQPERITKVLLNKKKKSNGTNN